PEALEPLGALLAEEVDALLRDPLRVAHDAAELAAVLVVPGAALARLEAVLVAHPHDLAVLLQGSEQRRDVLAELRAAGLEVLHEQVRQGVGRSADAEVGPCFPRQLADQVGEAAEPSLQLVSLRSALEAPDVVVDLAREHARLQEVRRDLMEDEVAGDHGAERVIRGGSCSFVDDLELVAELAGGAALIDGPERALP